MSTDQLVPTATWLTLLDLLRWRARSQSERKAYTFLLDGEIEEVHITYGELDQRARAIGALLQQHVAPGDRALLLYPPGLDYIAAFFGCMYAAVIAVPIYPPNPARPARTLPRLHDIMLDACPAAILTNNSFLSVSAKFAAQDSTFATMQWLATDMLPREEAIEWSEPRIDGNGSVRTQKLKQPLGTELDFCYLSPEKKGEREISTHELSLLRSIHNQKASEANRTWLCNLLLFSVPTCLQ